LSLEAFEALLDGHGGDLSRFPEGDKEAAQRLVETDERARALLASEMSTAAMLSELEALDPSPALMRRVFEIPAREEASARRPSHFSVFGGAWALSWKAGFAFTLLLALGAFAGWASDGTAAPDPSIATASDALEDSSLEDSSDASDEVTEEWETLSELAFAEELSEDF
jgi:hypothetical protein